MRCQHVDDDGDRCQAPEQFVNPETGFCHAHGPGAEDRMAERGQKGGQAAARKRRQDGLSPDELPPLDSPQHAERWLEVIGRAVTSGRLGYQEAKAGVRAVKTWLGAHEAGEVTERLEELTHGLAEWRETGDPSPVLELLD